MTIVARKPLMLKEYLELDDDDSEHIASSGFVGARVATTIRCLLDAELRCGEASLTPKARPSKNALTKFSAAIHAVKLLPFSSDGRCPPSGPEGSPSRSFSERLRGSFWGKKKKKQNENERAVARPSAEQQSSARLKDVIRIRSVDANGEGWRSLRFPSPIASSRSSWSETDSFGSDFLPASMASSESPQDIAASNSKHTSKKIADDEGSEGEAVDRGPAKELFSKAMEESAECRSDGEKEQLSPVSVIDYPYQQGHGDDDENNNDEEADSTSTASPSFYRSFGNIERTKEQLLNRIRRFEMLAAPLDLIDLERCSPSTDAEDPLESTDHVAPSDADEEEGEVRARDLLDGLKSRPLGSMEKLLMDLIQEQSCAGEAHRDRPMRGSHARSPRTALVEATEMLSAETECDDDHGEATLREMERNGRWRCFHEEEEDLTVHVEVSLLASLMEELVRDLILC